MKIKITGNPKEIAALALEMQRRQGMPNKNNVQELVSITVKRALGEKVRGAKF